jgi:hypothetical protein
MTDEKKKKTKTRIQRVRVQTQVFVYDDVLLQACLNDCVIQKW